MPVASVLSWLQGTLDDLPMPSTPMAMTANLACKITAPAVFGDPGVIPTCYAWAADGRESRKGPAASMPRNRPGMTGSGFKSVVHQAQLLLIWSGSGEQAPVLFSGMIDAIMAALRTAAPMPVVVTDPFADAASQISDAGEDMSYRTAVRPMPDQQANQYEALFQMTITEVIQA